MLKLLNCFLLKASIATHAPKGTLLSNFLPSFAKYKESMTTKRPVNLSTYKYNWYMVTFRLKVLSYFFPGEHFGHVTRQTR